MMSVSPWGPKKRPATFLGLQVLVISLIRPTTRYTPQCHYLWLRLYERPLYFLRSLQSSYWSLRTSFHLLRSIVTHYTTFVKRIPARFFKNLSGLLLLPDIPGLFFLFDACLIIPFDIGLSMAFENYFGKTENKGFFPFGGKDFPLAYEISSEIVYPQKYLT